MPEQAALKLNEKSVSGDGERLVFGSMVGSGGEGTVWRIQNRPDIAVKLYSESMRTDERAAKLRAMIANPPPGTTRRGHRSIAWPARLVVDRSGRVAGFTMSLVSNAKELASIINPRSRAAIAPGMTWRHALNIARNVSSVVAALHVSGYVVGDLSDHNFLVTDDGLVTLIDCDSLQVPNPAGGAFVSTVGTVRFTAPELLGIDFASQQRTPEGDRFALATLIFLLLFEGYHPFQGVPASKDFGGDDLSAIRSGAFAHSSSQSILTPPPAAPSFASLPAVLAQQFERTFIRGHLDPSLRVHADAWQSSLDSVLRSLQVCRREPQHVFWSVDQACPWCARAQSIGVDTWTLRPRTPAVPSTFTSTQKTATGTPPGTVRSTPRPSLQSPPPPPPARAVPNSGNSVLTLSVVGAVLLIGFLFVTLQLLVSAGLR